MHTSCKRQAGEAGILAAQTQALSNWRLMEAVNQESQLSSVHFLLFPNWLRGKGPLLADGHSRRSETDFLFRESEISQPSESCLEAGHVCTPAASFRGRGPRSFLSCLLEAALPCPSDLRPRRGEKSPHTVSPWTLRTRCGKRRSWLATQTLSYQCLGK